MTDDSPEVIYPEMLEYRWAKDLDRVMANSKYVKPDYSAPPVTADKLPKSPVNLVLAVIAESLSYPEVVEAQTKGHDMQRALHLLMWFDEYLLHKYGNNPDPRRMAARCVREIANGGYTGLDDQKLAEDLLSNQSILPDDGADYTQPSA